MYKSFLVKQNIIMEKKKIIFILVLFMILSVVNNYYARFILESYNNYFIKQILWYILSFIIMFIIYKININFINRYSFYFYLFGNFLLLLTLLIGSSVNGASAWLRVGHFTLQPSEFMKIFLILYLKEFTLKYKISDFKYIIFTFLIILIPSILTFLEPDTGAVIIYLIIWLVFLFFRKLNKWYYILGGGFILIFLLSFFLLYYKFQDTFINIFGTNFFYRMDRITNFINGDGYQINEALKSISNSGLFGIKTKVYFPESTTDFAFSLFISNFGIIGLIILTILYTYFIYLLLSLKSNKNLLYSVIFVILFQYVSNILMNVGLFPIIGITLPFISYGGSSLISFIILISILLKEKAPNSAYL